MATASTKRRKRKPAESAETAPVRRVTCPHCGSKRRHTYCNRTFPNGNRAMRCASCRKGFVDRANRGQNGAL